MLNSEDKLMVFEIWTSQGAFDKFGKTLMPILQQLGIDPGQPTVMPVHKVMIPTAKVASREKRATAWTRRQKLTVLEPSGPLPARRAASMMAYSQASPIVRGRSLRT